MYKYKGTYILSIIYKYKGTVHTYYHVQVQRYSTYLLSCTNTKVQYIFIILYIYKCILHTYNYVQIQRYSSYLLFTKVYICSILYHYITVQIYIDKHTLHN